MQQHFCWTPMWVFIHTSFIFIWLLYLLWLPLRKLEFWISILKTRIIRGLSLLPYKIQSVSTSAFTANQDLKPAGGKLSVRRSIFSETHVQFWRISQWVWVRAGASQQPGLFVSNFKEIASVQSSPSHFHIEKGDIGNSAIPPLEDDRSLRVGKLLRYSCN